MSKILTQSARRSGFALRFLFVTYTRLGTAVAILAAFASLGVAWVANYSWGGGSHSVFPHLFYVPILLAAVRFTWVGALGTAVSAGILAGPLLPADVATHQMQTPESWLLRLTFFVLIGLFVSWLVRERSESLRGEVHDSLTSGRLAKAVRRNQLEVLYQPIFHMPSHRLIAVEALVRWNHPRGDQLQPDEFIPAAERTGAIALVDDFVLSEAARQVQQWTHEHTPVNVSVNISATRFGQGDLPAHVADVLTATGLSPRALQLEITESALIDDVTAAGVQIARVRDLGVRVAIDDFGAGQASLNYLTRFTVDTVKIDRALVAHVATQPRTARLVGGLIGLFQAIDIDVVAEGIEDGDQYLMLSSLGCHYAQGFYTGRPVVAAAISALLTDRSSLLH
ncbi:MAG: EAL domain-containing protein [Mycobacteriaceae bacterium]